MISVIPTAKNSPVERSFSLILTAVSRGALPRRAPSETTMIDQGRCRAGLRSHREKRTGADEVTDSPVEAANNGSWHGMRLRRKV
jgi:hypothetical protein